MLEAKRKRFTWPDQPVIFDDLESYFMKSGLEFICYLKFEIWDLPSIKSHDFSTP
jgi:hypothetical protein